MWITLWITHLAAENKKTCQAPRKVKAGAREINLFTAKKKIAGYNTSVSPGVLFPVPFMK